jgi:hypothetical protein
VISLVALIVALGGAGYSATGGNFILGHSNVATTPTALNASLNHRTLSLGNPNPGAAATALGLIVPAGKPPMFVSSTGRVDRLNADMVDGLSANQLARVALDFDADVVSSVLFSDEAQITIQAPQAGFVLVNGALHFSTWRSRLRPLLRAHVHSR